MSLFVMDQPFHSSPPRGIISVPGIDKVPSQVEQVWPCSSN
jgi:hypothetical protein